MKIAATLAATFLSVTALDLQAAAPTEVETVTVQYADLNLDREAGVAKLYKRLRVAAKRVCMAGSSEMLVSKQSYAACIKLSVTTAVTQINRPALSNYVAQQLGEPIPGGTRVAAQ